MNNFFSKFKYLDIPLAIGSGLLLLAGLAMLYAISFSGDTMPLFYRQLAVAGLGVIIFLLSAFYNYQRLAKINRYIYPCMLVILLVLLLFGREIKGSSRWVDLGIVSFQPAEFVKLMVVLGLARLLYLRRGEINSWKNILLSLLYIVLPTTLIILQPDLGSALIVLAVWGGMLLLSPIRKQAVILLVVAGLAIAGLSWKFVLQDYQRHRIDVFLNPDLDPQGKGYNVRQAIIAVGSGGVAGRGLGKGLQSQLRFLPERNTDFIFASVAEEIGFMGSIVLVGLYGFVFWRMVKIMEFARDDLGMYIVGGVLWMLLGQVLINIGMNIGLMPVTGIPLPFMSYGRSSLLVVCMALGIVQNVAIQTKALRF